MPNTADRRDLPARAVPRRCCPRSSRSAIVPIGGVVTIAGHQTFLQLADLPFGILWLLAMSGLGLYGVLLAGWSSGSKYPLLGSVRASAQLLSYEAAFGLAIVGVLVQANTLSTPGIVHQAGRGTGFESIFNGDWYWLPAIVAFVDLRDRRRRRDEPPAVRPRGGGAGAHRRVLHRVHRHPVRDLLPRRVHEPHHDVGDRGDAVLRRPIGPGLGFLAANGWFNVWIMPVFWFMFKVIVLLFGTVWLRASLPRLRYDQLMDLGWKFLIEIAFLWVMISGVVIVAKEEGWSIVDRPCPPPIVGALAVGGVLLRCRMPEDGASSSRRSSEWAGSAGSRSRCARSARPKVTERFPKEKRPKPERFHGRHVLNRYEDGMEKCIGCELCAGVCPARCIYVRGADNPPDAPVSPGERYGFVYEINYLRCIHCDLCVEACPTEAITETKLFEFSFAEPRGRDLHEDRAARRRRRSRPASAVGAVARRRGRRHERLDARDRARPGRPSTRGGSAGRASSASACARPRSGSRRPSPRRFTSRAAEPVGDRDRP